MLFYFVHFTAIVSVTPAELYTVTSNVFSPSSNGYEICLCVAPSSLTRYPWPFNINSILSSPFSSETFTLKLSPSCVTSSFGFFTPLTSCVFIAVSLFISTAITVSVCRPSGISIIASPVVELMSCLTSSSL